jgi:hypothetical protein
MEEEEEEEFTTVYVKKYSSMVKLTEDVITYWMTLRKQSNTII